MSYSPAVEAPVNNEHQARRALPALGLLTFAVATVWTALGAHNVRETVVVTVVAAVVAAGVYGWVLPRALGKPSAGGTALTLSLVAVALTLPAFWSGLPLILGVAGAFLGNAGRHARTGAGTSIAALALGALATIAYLAIYIVDGLLMGNL